MLEPECFQIKRNTWFLAYQFLRILAHEIPLVIGGIFCQEVILFHLLDATEMEFPFNSPVLLRNPKTSCALDGELSHESTQYEYSYLRIEARLRPLNAPCDLGPVPHDAS